MCYICCQAACALVKPRSCHAAALLRRRAVYGTHQLAAACPPNQYLSACSLTFQHKQDCNDCDVLQVHLGYFATEVAAARAHDVAALTKAAKQGMNVVSNTTPAAHRCVHGSTPPGKPVTWCTLTQMHAQLTASWEARQADTESGSVSLACSKISCCEGCCTRV
jgi:hypothetical protein